MSFLDPMVFGTLGRGAKPIDMMNSDYTLTDDEASGAILVNTSTTPQTAVRKMKLPTVSTAGDAYAKYVQNDNGAGWAVQVIDQAGGTSVNIADTKGAWVWVTTTGVRRMTADT